MKHHKIDQRTAVGGLAGVTLLVGGVAGAVAGTITPPSQFFAIYSGNEHESYTPETGSWDIASYDSLTGQLPQYDGPGTLTGVSIEITRFAGSATSFALLNYADILSGSFTATTSGASQTIGITAFGESVTELISHPDLTCTLDVAHQDDCYLSDPVDFGPLILDMTAASFANFYGTGTFDVTGSVAGTGTFATLANGTVNHLYAYGSQGVSWEGYASVTYTFADVPEPAAVVLIATGLAGLATGRRRRQGAGQTG
ncbi:VPLPA-CTERM sorting domain-containing protein [Candidatus Thiodictyon syntrophicum]|jgi:hypothetical protein|nr:VPLPA-CTERM sorting domain-containing protein [Candidatus Thiodictyon syntrophicum]